MFTLRMVGKLAGFSEVQSGGAFIRLEPKELLCDVQEGERAGLVSFFCNPIPEGLAIGSVLEVEAVGYLGRKKWQKTSDFGKAMGKEKEIENLRLQLVKVVSNKPPKVPA